MKIGIVGNMSGDYFGVRANYMDWVAQFGTPVVISPGTSLPSEIEAVVLPGGADIVPHRYTKDLRFSVGQPDAYLEYFDARILPDIIGEVPIFGICRGLQTINVALGGTLNQDIQHPYSSYETHEVHGVFADGYGEFGVNSFHHQSIRTVGHGVTVVAREYDLEHEEFGSTIEAISGDNFFAVQWHPERLYDEYSIQRFSELLGGAK